jgi:hypothetical protein
MGTPTEQEATLIKVAVGRALGHGEATTVVLAACGIEPGN